MPTRAVLRQGLPPSLEGPLRGTFSDPASPASSMVFVLLGRLDCTLDSVLGVMNLEYASPPNYHQHYEHHEITESVPTMEHVWC